MKNEKETWDDLIESLHEAGSRREAKTEGIKGRQYGKDFQWAMEIKKRLEKVFLWDLFDKKEAKLRLDYRINQSNRSTIPHLGRLFIRAAVVLIAIISGVLIHSLLSDPFKEDLYTKIFVPPGQMTQIVLADGTKVSLNSGTTFKFQTAFSQSSREVFIDGEAFLEVAKDKNKPFIVHAQNFTAEVLGTSFNISAYSSDSRANVTLVEGSVRLLSEERNWHAVLAPGQRAIVSNGNAPEVTMVDTGFYTSWQKGEIVFRNETLEDIARKLERWYHVEIGFKDENLKQLMFSGTFLKYKPIDQVFKTLAIMNDKIDFVYETRNDKKNLIYIIRKTN
ncbi:MAG: FecR domain-containing protein [Prolixibacteraceae bacterium]